MKISQMLKREDFYSINEKTLNNYFNGQGEKTKLYVYPELNAIITSSPSAKVKKYLFNEYSVKGNLLKAVLIKCYVFACLFSKGLLAHRALELTCNMTDDMLIYPCNKKYRIFDFSSNTVDVIAKSGFPTKDLEQEMLFRTENKEDFIPELISANKNGYREKIIDGTPLARLAENFEKYRTLAIETLEEYSVKQGITRDIDAKDYVKLLAGKIELLVSQTSKTINSQLVLEFASSLVEMVPENVAIKLTLSHGDLQPGNIWVDSNGKMYIIDWESWGERSVWYDRAALYKNLRNAGLGTFLDTCDNPTEVLVVCLEDLIYRLTELNNLPFDYGEKDFEKYLQIVSSRKKG